MYYSSLLNSRELNGIKNSLEFSIYFDCYKIKYRICQRIPLKIISNIQRSKFFSPTERRRVMKNERIIMLNVQEKFLLHKVSDNIRINM